MKKENQKGESQHKREINFQDTKKDKTRKNKWKKKNSNKKETDKIIFKVKWKKTEKESFATQNKNFVKRFLVEKTERQQKTKKKEKYKKGGKVIATRKHRETKKKRVDFGRTRGKRKRQRRHSKRDNVEKVFFGVETVKRPKKKVVSKWVNTNFRWKKKQEDRKNTKNISPFSKKQKVETNEKYHPSKNM